MTISSFPRGWSVLSGELGTDVTVSTTSLSGGISIHFPSTAVANAVIVSDWIAVSDTTPTGGAESATLYYSVAANLQASSIAANKNVRIIIEKAVSDRSTIVQSTLFSGALTAANTWETVGNYDLFSGFVGATKWVRYRIDRPNDIDFDLYLDSTEVKQMPAGTNIEMTAGGTFTGSWAKIPLSVYSPVPNGFTKVTGNDIIVYAPGIYTFNASLELNDSYSDGDLFSIRASLIDYTGSAIATKYWYGSSVGLPAAYNAATNPLGMSVSGSFLFVPPAAGSTTEPARLAIEVIQQNGTFKDYGDFKVSIYRVTDR